MSSGFVLEMMTLVTGRCYLRKCSIRYAQDVNVDEAHVRCPQHRSAAQDIRRHNERGREKKKKKNEREREEYFPKVGKHPYAFLTSAGMIL